MLFVKAEDLKVGMRLARPIYNRQGVLLFERNSKLNSNTIANIHNFGLFGMFILEPAEPVPPMTKDDIEFERFQTMAVFSIQEELERMLQTKKSYKMQTIASMIVKKYGHLEKKINFNQNLRSREDYIFKHSLNVAILCAMLTHVLNVRLDEQHATVIAAVVHDIDKLSMAKDITDADELTPGQKEALRNAEVNAYGLIEQIFTEGISVRRICSQSQHLLECCDKGTEAVSISKMVMGSKILAVAEAFDSMTAMQIGKPPMSEVETIKFLLAHPEYFDRDVVNALINAINILVPGVSVELNTGDKALVLTENKKDILRPFILNFRNNSIMDLADKDMFDDIEIVDIMKTMDNRYIMDIDTLKQQGFAVDEPEYVAVKEFE